MRRIVSFPILSGNQGWILPAVETAILLLPRARSLQKITRDTNGKQIRRMSAIFYIRIFSYEFQSTGRAIEAVSTSASVVFLISRVLSDPRWHEDIIRTAILGISGIGWSEQIGIYLRFLFSISM